MTPPKPIPIINTRSLSLFTAAVAFWVIVFANWPVS